MTRDEIIRMAREAGVLAAQTLHLYRTEGALCDSEIQALRAAERLAQAAFAAGAAERKPLTIEQIDRMWADEWDGFVSFEEAKVIVHSVEQAHGIK